MTETQPGTPRRLPARRIAMVAVATIAILAGAWWLASDHAPTLGFGDGANTRACNSQVQNADGTLECLDP